MGPLCHLNYLLVRSPLYHLGDQHSLMDDGVYFDIPVYEHFHFVVHRLPGVATPTKGQSRSRYLLQRNARPPGQPTPTLRVYLAFNSLVLAVVAAIVPFMRMMQRLSVRSPLVMCAVF